MKIGSAVLGVHIAVLCAFSLTQGCVTSESRGSGRGARLKGPFPHEYKKTEEPAVAIQPSIDVGDNTGAGSLNNFYPIDLAPIEPQTGAASSSSTESYIVRKGDTLSQLAVDFDTTTAEMIRLNNLSNPDVLYVGQELRVPAGRGASKPSSSKSSMSVKKGGTYTIQKGDTLSEIALAAGVGIDDLRKLNNIKGDKIMAGETLDIPAGGKVPEKKSKPAATKPVAKKAEPKVEPAAPAPSVPQMELPPIATTSTNVDAPEGTAPSKFDVIEERIYYPGESLDDIAREYGVSKDEIMRLNNITDESQIRDGQRLRIPIAE